MRSVSFKKALVAGLAAVIVAGAAIGVAAAQQTPTPTGQAERGGRQQAFLTALANRLHIGVDQLTQAMTDARKDAGLPDRSAGGRGPKDFGFRGGRGMMEQALDTAASAIGISADQLKRELPGNSLAKVATDHGKSADVVIKALTDAANKRIDDAVAANQLSADRAAQMKTRISQMIPDMVNRQVPNRAARSAHAEDGETQD